MSDGQNGFTTLVNDDSRAHISVRVTMNIISQLGIHLAFNVRLASANEQVNIHTTLVNAGDLGGASTFGSIQDLARGVRQGRDSWQGWLISVTRKIPRAEEAHWDGNDDDRERQYDRAIVGIDGRLNAVGGG